MEEEKKKLVNAKVASFIITMGISTNKWDDIPYPRIIFYPDLITKILADGTHHWWIQRNVFAQKTQHQHNVCGIYHPWCFSRTSIDKNEYLLDNQSTCNAFVNGRYLPNIRDAPDRQYIRVHWNVGVTYTNKIGDLPGYSKPVWYNPCHLDWGINTI